MKINNLFDFYYMMEIALFLVPYGSVTFYMISTWFIGTIKEKRGLLFYIGGILLSLMLISFGAGIFFNMIGNDSLMKISFISAAILFVIFLTLGIVFNKQFNSPTDNPDTANHLLSFSRQSRYIMFIETFIISLNALAFVALGIYFLITGFIMRDMIYIIFGIIILLIVFFVIRRLLSSINKKIETC